MTSSVSHAGLSGYLLRNRIDVGPDRADGAVALIFDGNVRVLFHPACCGVFVAEVQLVVLSSTPAIDEQTVRAARAAASSRPLEDAARLVLPPGESRLVLHA